jgi:hypothetical protein
MVFKDIIYPVNNLTSSPKNYQYKMLSGIPTQNTFGQNNLARSVRNRRLRWNTNNMNDLTGKLDVDNTNVYDYTWWKMAYGQRYGLDPQYSQENGYFQINERTR